MSYFGGEWNAVTELGGEGEEGVWDDSQVTGLDNKNGWRRASQVESEEGRQTQPWICLSLSCLWDMTLQKLPLYRPWSSKNVVES